MMQHECRVICCGGYDKHGAESEYLVTFLAIKISNFSAGTNESYKTTLYSNCLSRTN